MVSEFAIDTVLFDYGGVLAEEGFKTAIPVIAGKNRLDPAALMKDAFEVVYSNGFTSGRIRQDAFWAALRAKTGIRGTDEELTQEVLSRFTLRPWMIDIVRELKQAGKGVSILSDQTHWLDELNERDGFFHLFDHVFNSFHMGITKKDPSIFDEVLGRMGVSAGNVLFIDDHLSNIERAREKRLHTIYYTGRKEFLEQLKIFFPREDR